VDAPFDLGPVLTAGSQDSLEELAGKFGVTVAKLLQWNPDLASSAAAAMGRRLCEFMYIHIHVVRTYDRNRDLAAGTACLEFFVCCVLCCKNQWAKKK
jgi:hypothetical protein